MNGSYNHIVSKDRVVYIKSCMDDNLYVDLKTNSKKGKIVVQPFSGREQQQWEIRSSPTRSGCFALVNCKTNRALEIYSDFWGNKFIVTSKDKFVAEEAKSDLYCWKWDNHGKSIEYIADDGKPKKRMLFDVKGAHGKPGTEVILYEENGGNNQQFLLIDIPKKVMNAHPQNAPHYGQHRTPSPYEQQNNSYNGSFPGHSFSIPSTGSYQQPPTYQSSSFQSYATPAAQRPQGGEPARSFSNQVQLQIEQKENTNVATPSSIPSANFKVEYNFNVSFEEDVIARIEKESLEDEDRIKKLFEKYGGDDSGMKANSEGASKTTHKIPPPVPAHLQHHQQKVPPPGQIPTRPTYQQGMPPGVPHPGYYHSTFR